MHCLQDLQVLFSVKILLKLGYTTLFSIYAFKNYFITVFSIFNNKQYLISVANFNKNE